MGMRHGRGRWSALVGSAICCRSSSSPPARRCSTCRRRWRHGYGCSGTGQSTKTDPNDAHSVAVAALRAPSLAPVHPADHTTVCRLLVKHHNDLARWRNKLCCRLHALVAELVPGGINKEVVVNQARSLLDSVEPDDVAAVERHRQAVELVGEIERLDVFMGDSRARITAAVEASGTTLREIFGVGPIVACMLIGYSGDPTRFTTASRLRRLHRHRPDRVLLRRTDRASAVTARQPAAQPRPAHRRDHPDPLPRTARAGATTTANSPKARPHAKRSAPSSAGSATSSGVTSSPTPAASAPLTSGPGGTTSGRLCRLRDRLTPEHRLFGEVTAQTLTTPYDHRPDESDR